MREPDEQTPLTFLGAEGAAVCDPETGICEVPPQAPGYRPA